MRQEILAVIVGLLVVGSLGVGYLAGGQMNVRTTASTVLISTTTTEEATVQCSPYSDTSKLFVDSAFTNGTTITGLGVVISDSTPDWSEWNCSGITPTTFSLVNGQLYTVSMQPQYANCILSYWQGPHTGNSGYYEEPIAINQTTTLVAAYDCGA